MIYMNLYCKSCKFHTTMEYESHCHNFICDSCNKFLIGTHGHEIFEFDDAGDIELYITNDMFIYLNQQYLFKSLMKIYDGRIWISTEE